MSEFKKSGGFGGNNRGGHGQRGSGRPGFGGRPDFNRGGDREMFTATCDQCHKQCEVPFRPTGEKPVYCRDCFAGKREGHGDNFSKRDSFPRKDFSGPQSSHAPDRRIDDLKRQLDGMSLKLDTLLKIMDGGVSGVKKVSEQKEKPLQFSSVPEKSAAVAASKEKKAVVKKKPVKKKK
jgi:CxxC-x17-CxxC domain-containing protein